MRLPSSLPHPFPSTLARRLRRLAAAGLVRAALAIPFLAPAAASAAYGDIREVPARSAVPEGWVHLGSETLEDGEEVWVLKDCPRGAGSPGGGLPGGGPEERGTGAGRGAGGRPPG